MKCIRPWYSEKQRTLLPCGKCAFCTKKLIDAWCLRLRHEMDVSSSAYFITLTYNDEHLPEDRQLSKRDLQLFLKRLRKKNSGIRFFAVGEYGTEGDRPHYHAIIFNLLDLNLITDSWKDKEGNPIGFIVGSPATAGRIRYMVSYMALPQDVNHREPPFRLMSRRPGIGFNYVEKNKQFHRARGDPVIYDFSTPNAMPRYYKDKIFTNRYQKKLIQKKMLAFSEKHPQRPSEWEHTLLLKKLNRKNK